jgi:hypothetical protein
MSKTFSPEHRSVEAFVEFCLDDEVDTFLPGDAQKIAQQTHRPLPEIIEELKSFGLRVRLNIATQSVRGVTSNPNGAHPFSGANATFSTSGGSSISGFAGREGC